MNNLYEITFLRFQQKNDFGHFSEWSTHFENAAKSYGCKFEIIYFSLSDVEGGARGLIDKLARVKIEHLFIEWFHDVYPGQKEFIDYLRQNKIEWSCLAALSSVYRSPTFPRTNEHPNEAVKKDLEKAYATSKLKAVFTFDKYLINQNTRLPFFPLPDYQDLRIGNSEIDCCNFCKTKRPIIGLLGQLYGYRGVTSLVRYWLRNPKLKLFFAGKYDPNFLPKFSEVWLKIGTSLKSFYFFPDWLSNSAAVNHCIRHLDALYIDTSRYPYPSGIAQRARSLGIPVIIENSDCYLRDQKIIGGDNGIFYSDILSFKMRNKIKDLLANTTPTQEILIEESYKALQVGWFHR